MAAHVFEKIQERSKEMPIKLCGLHSLDSCRIEKAYRHYGHDISTEDNIIEAGLGFAVKTQKPKSKFETCQTKAMILVTTRDYMDPTIQTRAPFRLHWHVSVAPF